MSAPPTVVFASNGADIDRFSLSVKSVRKYVPEARVFVLTRSPGVFDGYGVITVNPERYLRVLGLDFERWNRKWPPETIFRTSVPLLEDIDCDRVLYLDTDTLVRSGRVMELFSIGMGRFEAMACEDGWKSHFRDRNRVLCNSDVLSPEAKEEVSSRIWSANPPDKRVYANAGVELINVEAVRGDLPWYRRRMIWFLAAVNSGRLHFLDQDFLNFMMNTYSGLGFEFNHFRGDASTECVIQHFVSGSKSRMKGVAASIGVS